jgi:hypothetical protein
MVERPAIFCPAVGQDAPQRDGLLFKDGEHPIIEPIGSQHRRFRRRQLNDGQSTVGIDPGLLVNPSDTLDGAHLVRVLRAPIAGLLGFDFPFGFALRLGFLSRLDLGFSQTQALIGGQQGFQAFLEVFQVMPQPDRAPAARRPKDASFLQFVRPPVWPVGWVVRRELHPRVFNFGGDTMLFIGLLPTNLAHAGFTVLGVRYSAARRGKNQERAQSPVLAVKSYQTG